MTTTKNTKAITVSFTGHRADEGNALGDNMLSDEAGIRRDLRKLIMDLYDRGFRVFMSGMARGFDLLAAEVVLSMKSEFSDISLIAVYPFSGRKNSSEIRNILGEIDNEVSVSDRYHERCFHLRNDYLIDNSSLLICYYSGKPGGTRYTVRRAARLGLPVINLRNNAHAGMNDEYATIQTLDFDSI